MHRVERKQLSFQKSRDRILHDDLWMNNILLFVCHDKICSIVDSKAKAMVFEMIHEKSHRCRVDRNTESSLSQWKMRVVRNVSVAKFGWLHFQSFTSDHVVSVSSLFTDCRIRICQSNEYVFVCLWIYLYVCIVCLWAIGTTIYEVHLMVNVMYVWFLFHLCWLCRIHMEVRERERECIHEWVVKRTKFQRKLCQYLIDKILV